MKAGLADHCSRLWAALPEQSTQGESSKITWDVSLEHLLMPALEAYEHVSVGRVVSRVLLKSVH